MGDKYLSELIEEHKDEIIGNAPSPIDIQLGYAETLDFDLSNTEKNLVLITAGVGAGKNTWVQQCLTKELEGYDNILFITSRKLIKKQMLKDIDFSDDFFECFNYRSNYVITHHSLKKFFKDYTSFQNLLNQQFKYIVIDEVHSIIADAGYTDTAFYLYTLIKYYISNGIRVICLSATTDKVIHFFDMFKNFRHFDFTEECKNVKPKSVRVISKEKAFNLLAQANSKNKMLYMANSVTDICRSYYKKLTKDFKVSSSSIGIVISENRCSKEKNSTNNTDLKNCLNNMSSLVEYIVEKEQFPENTNIVLSSSRIREGVNIKDDNIKAMFCEAHSYIDIAQFSGRYRNNIDTLYIIHDTRPHFDDKDIDSNQVEYNFLKNFALDTINIYSSILQYNAFGNKTPYLNNRNFEFYCSTIYSNPQELLDIENNFFENGTIKTNEELTELRKNYYSNEWIRFNNFIQERYSLVRYNIILNKYELYYSKYFYVKEEYENYENYKKDTIGYLKNIFRIEDIALDDSIKYINSNKRKKFNTQVIINFLKNNNYINVRLNKEQQNEILTKIYSLPEVSFEKQYSTLGILLRAFKIKTERVGANKKGDIKISI